MTLGLEIGDLGFADDGRGPSRTAVQSLLARSLSVAMQQEDERMETLRGTLLIIRTLGGGVRSASSRGILVEAIRAWVRLREAGEVRVSGLGAAPDIEKSCAASGLESQHWSSKQSCNQPQHGVQRSWALLRRRLEARRLAGLGTVSGDNANVSWRAAVSGVRAVPRPSTDPQSAPLGLEVV